MINKSILKRVTRHSEVVEKINSTLRDGGISRDFEKKTQVYSELVDLKEATIRLKKEALKELKNELSGIEVDIENRMSELTSKPIRAELCINDEGFHVCLRLKHTEIEDSHYINITEVSHEILPEYFNSDIFSIVRLSDGILCSKMWVTTSS